MRCACGGDRAAGGYSQSQGGGPVPVAGGGRLAGWPRSTSALGVVRSGEATRWWAGGNCCGCVPLCDAGRQARASSSDRTARQEKKSNFNFLAFILEN
jgi:hypothetical protein